MGVLAILLLARVRGPPGEWVSHAHLEDGVAQLPLQRLLRLGERGGRGELLVGRAHLPLKEPLGSR